MSDESAQPEDPKEKFRAALEKKKNKGTTPGSQGSTGSKVGQGKQGPSSKKMFRRKAGG